MIDSKGLLALAERCEAGEQGFYINKEILAALGFTWRGMAYWSADDKTTWDRPSDFTTSLDAAVTLVPGNATWEVAERGDAEVTVLTGRFLVSDDIERHAHARTPALALCAAALKARAALAEGTATKTNTVVD